MLYAFAFAFSLIACDKDVDIVENTEKVTTIDTHKKSEVSEIDNQLVEHTKKYNGEYIKANFIGRIINENNEPIKKAKVTIGEYEKETDQNGIVVFSNILVQQYFAYARVFADGYLDGSRVIGYNLHDGRQNNFTIKLFKFNEVAHINSDEGGKVNFKSKTGDGVISFNPGFTDESGNKYHGDVAISINYLDPLDPDTADTMPGDLYGFTQDFEQVVLGSYGMIQVELRGVSGEKLQIIDPAKLMMPIDPDQINTAAEEVPMWSFNEHAGVWYEETIAYKEGNHYISEIPHFSFWNCDAPFPVVNFSTTVIDSTSLIPVAGLRVEITYNGHARFATTNSSGIVSGKIPANQTMTIKILDNCGNLLYINSSFGPFTGTTNITIPVTPNPLLSFQLSGTVDDCSGLPVNNGYVILNSTSGQYITGILVTGGTYNYTGINCILPSNISVVGIDLSNGQSSTNITTINPGSNTQNITLCGGLASEYIRYRINTTTGPYHYDLLKPYANIRNGNIFIGSSTTTRGTYMHSNTIVPGTGYSFGSSSNSMFIEFLSDINGLDPNATMALSNPITFDLISVGSIGQYISINFAGDYVDYNGTINTIQGEVRIYRDN